MILSWGVPYFLFVSAPYSGMFLIVPYSLNSLAVRVPHNSSSEYRGTRPQNPLPAMARRRGPSPWTGGPSSRGPGRRGRDDEASIVVPSPRIRGPVAGRKCFACGGPF